MGEGGRPVSSEESWNIEEPVAFELGYRVSHRQTEGLSILSEGFQ